MEARAPVHVTRAKCGGAGDSSTALIFVGRVCAPHTGTASSDSGIDIRRRRPRGDGGGGPKACVHACARMHASDGCQRKASKTTSTAGRGTAPTHPPNHPKQSTSQENRGPHQCWRQLGKEGRTETAHRKRVRRADAGGRCTRDVGLQPCPCGKSRNPAARPQPDRRGHRRSAVTPSTTAASPAAGVFASPSTAAVCTSATAASTGTSAKASADGSAGTGARFPCQLRWFR